MDVKRYEEINKKIKILEKEEIENKTKLKSIIENLKKYDIEDIDQAIKLIDELSEKIESNNNRLDDLMKKIEQSVDWDEIGE